MAESKYPKYRKSKTSGVIYKFIGITTAIIIDSGVNNTYEVGTIRTNIIPCNSDNYEDVMQVVSLKELYGISHT